VHPRWRWPKGAFPERYRFDAVARRLAGALEDPARRAAMAALEAEGFRAHPAGDDPLVRLFEGVAPPALPALRARVAPAPIVLFRYCPSPRDPTLASACLGVVGSDDAVDAAVAVGVAGPEHGIGTAAIVRFLVALRSFAAWEIEGLGESRITLALAPRSAEAALRIAEQALRICPPLRGRIAPQALAEAMRSEHTLDLDYA
jgi:hypothetical protein